METGTLYLCPTPIGNLEDMTYRTIRVLNEVDIIAAEDTRHTIKLLNHFEISKKLMSYHEHNKGKVGPQIIRLLNDGKSVALVSDAGTPGISDPGEDLVKLAIEQEIEYYVLPGASAMVVALVSSGLSTKKFTFEGFLDRDKKTRKKELEKVKKDHRTLIFYESPHRLTKTLKDMFEILGNRKITLVREISKKFEEKIYGSISELIERCEQKALKGEIVLIIEGSSEIEEKQTFDMPIRDHILMLIEDGLTKKDAIKKVAKDREISKQEVYKESFDL